MDRNLKLLVFWQFCLLISQVTIGYDNSLVGSLQTMPQWLNSMGHPSNNILGFLVCAIFIGSFASAFFAPTICDRFGRRITIFLGSVLCIVGLVLQAVSNGRVLFIVGRIIAGIGVGLDTCGGAILILELAHPSHRGTISSMYNVLWYIGSIMAAWISFGTSYMKTTWSWRIPCIFQGLPALWVAIAIIFSPESPRYLYSRGRTREAEAILTYYHANGQESHPIVLQEMAEISTALDVEAELEPQSFLSTLKVPAYRKCYAICIAVSLFTNWCGQSVISYYFSPILKSLGISSTPEQTGINGGLQVWNLLCSLTGAFLAERIGRRRLWLSSFLGMIGANVALTITSAIYAQKGDLGAARASIVFLFFYDAFFNIACNPLLYSYPPEILPYRIRGKGMGVLILTSEVALTVN